MAHHAPPPVSGILCPVDFSRCARAALRYAVILTRDSGAPLTALYVNDPLLVAAASITFDHRIEQRSLAELERFVGNVVHALGRTRRAGGRSLDVRCEQTTGHPATAILDAARRKRSDLIVIGTEGLSGVRKLFFGSTTHEVIRRASIPVVILGRTIRADPASRWPGRHLLVPLDLGPRSEHDAQIAAALAADAGAALTLVHVVAPVRTPPWYRGDGAMLDRLRLTRARNQLAALATRLDCPADVRVTIGAPAHIIATTARTTRSSLVVMSVRDGEGLLRARPGSIAYEVVCEARVPVLVLPSRHRSRRLARR